VPFSTPNFEGVRGSVRWSGGRVVILHRNRKIVKIFEKALFINALQFYEFYYEFLKSRKTS